jgi:hypothetical protein
MLQVDKRSEILLFRGVVTTIDLYSMVISKECDFVPAMNSVFGCSLWELSELGQEYRRYEVIHVVCFAIREHGTTHCTKPLAHPSRDRDFIPLVSELLAVNDERSSRQAHQT